MAGARIEAGATVTGSVISPGAVVGEGAVVDGSILGHAAVVGPGARLGDLTVLGDGETAT
jgi:mannose-1-phosphate guanylyltransferase